MNYHITSLPKSEIEIKIELTPEEVALATQKALEEMTNSVDIDGFRKGKAPQELVRKKVGENELSRRTLLYAVQDSYPQALKELQDRNNPVAEPVEPIGPPKIQVTKFVEGGALEYTARLSILPALTLPDYKQAAKAVLANKKNPEVSEKEVGDSIAWLKKSRAREITVTRAVQESDRVEVDFEARVAGVALENGKSQNHPIVVGEGRFLPGFEKELVGMKEGEEKTFSLVVPADYAEKELSGKTVDFHVVVKLVQERIIPEADDAFAAALGNFKNIDELKTSIRQGILTEKEEKERERTRIAIIEAVAEKTKGELPTLLIERELDKMLAELKANIGRMKLDWTAYLANIKTGEEELKKGWAKDAERRVKIALTLREIAKVEKIEPDETELQEAASKTLARMDIGEEELKKIDRGVFLEYNTTIARNEKVFKFLEGIV
ncbi:MAG: trigger factor [Candidatus Sungbacteria bacterium]|nr:trigger factor [Candidatus Sungbacteria bacterium]